MRYIIVYFTFSTEKQLKVNIFYFENYLLLLLNKLQMSSNFLSLIKTNSRLIPIFFFTIFTLSPYTNCETATIEVATSQSKILSFYTLFISNSIEKADLNQEDSLSFTGKLCSADNTTQVVTNCFEKFENFNYNWVGFK